METTGRRAIDVLAVALRLGLTSFGGPIAHIGYFRRAYVEQRHWLDEQAFGELVALCQSLPGPASSQLGIAIGTLRAGHLGGLAAWVGFTLPSAVALVSFALLTNGTDVAAAPWVHGLKLAAAAVVIQALWMMRRSLAPDAIRRAIALVAMAAALVIASPLTPTAIIVGGAVAGLLLLRTPPGGPAEGLAATPIPVVIGRRAGIVALSLFALLLVALPVLRAATGSAAATVGDTFYRTGALVFGGGHVVLPLLHESVVTAGWLDEGRFLAGYGAAQAVPGPLFTFAGYVGAIMSVGPGGVAGALLALVSIFLPGALLIWGALPFWTAIRRSGRVRHLLGGTGAAVVGLLAAALYDPIWRGSVATPADAAIALGGVILLTAARMPPLVVVVGAALIAQVAPGF